MKRNKERREETRRIIFLLRIHQKRGDSPYYFFAKNSPHQQTQMCRELARQWALKHGSSVNPSVMLGRVKKPRNL